MRIRITFLTAFIAATITTQVFAQDRYMAEAYLWYRNDPPMILRLLSAEGLFMPGSHNERIAMLYEHDTLERIQTNLKLAIPEKRGKGSMSVENIEQMLEMSFDSRKNAYRVSVTAGSSEIAQKVLETAVEALEKTCESRVNRYLDFVQKELERNTSTMLAYLERLEDSNAARDKVSKRKRLRVKALEEAVAKLMKAQIVLGPIDAFSLSGLYPRKIVLLKGPRLATEHQVEQ